MGKIFKQLARHWAACLVVIGLLFVQAYCDLSLPDYTSKIVDTGIQQGGIESPLPQTLRSSTRDALSLLMREEDAETFRNAYGYYIQDDGVLKLRADLTAEATCFSGRDRHHAGHRAVYGCFAGCQRHRDARAEHGSPFGVPGCFQRGR